MPAFLLAPPASGSIGIVDMVLCSALYAQLLSACVMIPSVTEAYLVTEKPIVPLPFWKPFSKEDIDMESFK